MLARIRNAREDEGFTLIELLVVMIIIGILAAIAIPVFLSQRAKAQDSATKADVSTVGKEIATYFVDNTAAPTSITISAGGRYVLAYGTTNQDLGKASNNVAIKTGSPHFSTTTPATKWCIALTNPQGSTLDWKYSAANGLQSGDCVSGTDY
jgi:prepilin-type N-terminal cleavage/methylation domain-containing protein